MRVCLRYGLTAHDFEVPEGQLVAPAPRAAHGITDVPEAVRRAVEFPTNFPPLRRSLTPDDHVAVVVDESLPGLPRFLNPLLEHVVEAAGVQPENVTLVCATRTDQAWIDELPDALQDVRVEVHDPKERKRLGYLATTKGGRRVYLNRTLVDADVGVVLARCAFDDFLGVTGGPRAIYPALADQATLDALRQRWTTTGRDMQRGLTRQEAEETAWLLGAPFYVQVLEGVGDEVSEVVAGSGDALKAAAERLTRRWGFAGGDRADVVAASVVGGPERATFAEVARAAAAAGALAGEAGARVVLLTAFRNLDDPGVEFLRRWQAPDEAMRELRRQPVPPELRPAKLWLKAVQANKVYLLSDLDEGTVEDLFATPLVKASEAQRLLDGGARCGFLEDGQKYRHVPGAGPGGEASDGTHVPPA